MLERMYIKFAERQGFKPEIVEETEGDVAGIKGCTIKITGDYAYGWLRTETGIHRLVRKSPVRLQRTPSYFFCFCVRRSRSRRFF